MKNNFLFLGYFVFYNGFLFASAQNNASNQGFSDLDPDHPFISSDLSDLSAEVRNLSPVPYFSGSLSNASGRITPLSLSSSGRTTPLSLRGRSLSPCGEKFFRAISPYLFPRACCVDFSYAHREILKEDNEDVIYLTDEEKEQFRIAFLMNMENFSKVLTWEDGSLVDTTKWSSKKGRGYGAYAISVEGNLYIAEHRSPTSNHPNYGDDSLPPLQREKNRKYFYHSSFFRGGPGVCFGMIRVEHGLITHIDRSSGHYKPTEKHFQNAIKLLSQYFSPDCKKEADVFWEHRAADLFYDPDNCW
jgi:hypothetical protein